jgi:hypothetical protein
VTSTGSNALEPSSRAILFGGITHRTAPVPAAQSGDPSGPAVGSLTAPAHVAPVAGYGTRSSRHTLSTSGAGICRCSTGIIRTRAPNGVNAVGTGARSYLAVGSPSSLRLVFDDVDRRRRLRCRAALILTVVNRLDFSDHRARCCSAPATLARPIQRARDDAVRLIAMQEINGAPIDIEAAGCCVGLLNMRGSYAACQSEPTISGIVPLPETGEFVWVFTCDRHAVNVESPRAMTQDDHDELNRRRLGRA